MILGIRLSARGKLVGRGRDSGAAKEEEKEMCVRAIETTDGVATQEPALM